MSESPEFLEFTSSHNPITRTYRVRLAPGPVYVEYLHPPFGWLESVNANTRAIAYDVRERALGSAQP